MELPRGLTTLPTQKVRIRTFWGATRGGGLSGTTLDFQTGCPVRLGSLLVWHTSGTMKINILPLRGYVFRLGLLLGYF